MSGRRSRFVTFLLILGSMAVVAVLIVTVLPTTSRAADDPLIAGFKNTYPASVSDAVSESV